MSKYHNRKVTSSDGHKFDSMVEHNRYLQLRQAQTDGDITDLILQPVFVLQEAFKLNGKTEKPITYIADFGYVEASLIVIEDVKGMETEVFRIKRKLFLFRYPHIELRIVKVGR